MRPLEERYARALFQVLGDELALRAESELRSDVELLTNTGEVWAVLRNPCVRPGEKTAVVERLAGKDTSPALLNLYRILCSRGEISLLPRILEQYHALCLEADHAAEGLLCCARPMDRESMEKLEQTLCRLHGKSRIVLRTAVDPSLLGGFVLQLGDATYDKSVRGMLNGLRRSLKER